MEKAKITLDVKEFSNAPKRVIEDMLNDLLVKAGYGEEKFNAQISTENQSSKNSEFDSMRIKGITQNGKDGHYVVVIQVRIKGSGSIWVTYLSPCINAINQVTLKLIANQLKKSADELQNSAAQASRNSLGIEQALKRIGDLEEELEVSQLQLEQSNQAWETAESQAAELEKVAQGLLADKSELEDANDRLALELATKEKELAALQAEKVKLETSNESLKLRIAELEQCGRVSEDQEQQKKEISRLSEELMLCKTLLDALANVAFERRIPFEKMLKAHRVKEQLTSALQKVSMMLTETANRANELEACTLALQQQLLKKTCKAADVDDAIELKKQNTTLKRKLKKSEQERQSIAKQLSVQTEELVKMNEQLKELKQLTRSLLAQTKGGAHLLTKASIPQKEKKTRSSLN